LFSYRAYDCVPPSPDDGFSWLDVLIVDSLNAKLRHPVIMALHDAADRSWPHVALAVERANGRAFWELPPEEVVRRPPAGTVGEALNRAWEECMRTDDVGVALTHKLLHHKQPALFPLIDNRTGPLLDVHADSSTVGRWAVVHRELTTNRTQFAALERTVNVLLDGPNDVPLNRLRLHDVLLWLVATGNFGLAESRGRACEEWCCYSGTVGTQSLRAAAAAW
jgi:hypothetical protein